MNDLPVHKQRILAVILVIISLTALISIAYAKSAKNVVLEVNNDVEEIKSRAGTVEELLKEEAIQIKHKGYINYPLDTELEDEMYVIVKDPKKYIIEVGEEQEEILSPFETVKEILADSSQKVEDLDYSEPPLDAEVKEGETIKFFKVKEVLEDVEKSIPFEEVVTKNRDLDSGVKKVVQKGENGVEKSKVKKKYINDELVETTTVQTELVKKPVSQLVEKGTRQVVASRGSGPRPANIDSSKGIVMNATAYDLSYASTGKRPGDKHYGMTASGTRARPGVVAVDPRVIPLGTKLYIESLDGTPDYGYASAEDTGGAIKGKKVDLFFESSTAVRNFGRRKVRVHILK